MLESRTYTIRGVQPTIMHNGQLANPLSRFAKAIKEVAAKRKKTDEDHIEIARLEFLGSLYLLGGDGPPCWPGQNIEVMLRDAARQEKRGKDVTRHVFIPDDCPIAYKGPTEPDALWADDRFRFICSARVGQARVMRCRPIFHDWKLAFTVQFSSESVNPEDVDRWVALAGTIIGLSDFRPRYGRFTVEAIS